ncbi:hypothetical protein COU75_03500 [Candidatus Peregrinibacteria bacterium CG10_big_fil_rev_8_21_14_0_10_42_8]|nr:MAG: hypothetical protein COU75_03500 [Candidatus Peregrinibacteria bacterium CG10_big_fil_rev_8_21_14_0_10_42_8]
MKINADTTLLWEITKSNFKLQNESSALGIIWYLLGPLLLFGIMLFVFSHRLGSDVDKYPLYLLMGIITWNFFSTGAGRCMTTITGNASLIKSIPIRIEILIIAAIFHALITHSIEIFLFLALLLLSGIIPILIPLYLIVLVISFIFTIGVGFALSATFVIFRDVQQIWSVITRAWWFATPIFYVPTTTGLGSKLSLFNPLYYSIHLSRELLIYNRIPPLYLFVIFFGMSLISLLLGYYIFRKLQPNFVALI